MPDQMSPLNLCSSLNCSAKGADALTPKSIKVALKSSLILFDSTPLPKHIALYQSKE